MPLPFLRDSRPDDRLIRYLLGDLSDAEAEQLDEQSVVDDAFAFQLKGVEDDLVDAYVRGRLDERWHERFESHYLASPKRRAKVAFAKKFLVAVDGAAGADDAAKTAHPGALTRLAPWAFAAAAVLTLSTGTLLVRTARLSREAQNAAAEIAAANHRASALSEQLNDQRQAADAARKALNNAPTPSPLAAYAVVLLPETRGTGPVPLVAIGDDALTVPLELRIDAAPAPGYMAALRDPATNGIVWRDRSAAASRIRPATVVSVNIPATILKAQHYSLDLFEARHGAAAFLASYAFEVVRR